MEAKGPGGPQATMHGVQKAWAPPEWTCCEQVSCCTMCFFTSLCFCGNFEKVNCYERAVLMRHGRRVNEKELAGGLHYLIPSVDELLKVDIRECIIDIPRQSVVTREGTQLDVDGVVYYKVFDANKALMEVKDVRQSINLLAQTKLREVLALHTYQQIQVERLTLAKRLKAILDSISEPWGVDVTRVELTDLRLPIALQTAMNQEQESQRRALADMVAANSRAEIAMVDAKGRSSADLVKAEAVANAKRIEAEGEKAAAEDFKSAADIMAQNPTTLQLRYLQTLKSMGHGRTNTVLMPFNNDTVGMAQNAQSMAAAQYMKSN